MPLTILVVDDEKTVRSALGRLLSARSEWKIVGEANDGVEAVAKTRDLKPDVVIMDVTMPEMNGLEATPQTKQANPATEVLVFTQHDSNQMIREAQKAGASGYLLKSQAHWLSAAVEAMSQHKPFFQSQIFQSQKLKPFSFASHSTIPATGQYSPFQFEIKLQEHPPRSTGCL